MKFYEILIEVMTPHDAAEIFRKHGIDPKSADLHSQWRQASKKIHSDIGGDPENAALFNAAYDVLKTARADRKLEPEPDEPWAHAGYSGGAPNSSRINRQDYTDMNYIKKKMWELSRHSNVEWSITGFDGAFSRASITVYGSPKIFAQMAHAVVTWQTKGGNPYPCRAVYVQRRRSSDSTVYIIWADGVSYANDPIPLEYESFNRNPSNDSSFKRRLRKLIDDLQENGGR